MPEQPIPTAEELAEMKRHSKAVLRGTELGRKVLRLIAAVESLTTRVESAERLVRAAKWALEHPYAMLPDGRCWLCSSRRPGVCVISRLRLRECAGKWLDAGALGFESEVRGE